MPDLLLELFSEEIPARMQRQAAEDLKRLVTNALVERNLIYEGAQSFVTPRRLTLHVVGLPAAQANLREERKGPRVGAPEAAIQGFLKSAGLSRIEDARVETDPRKGQFYVAVIERPGRETKDAIAEIIPAIIRSFPWPKSMRWGAERGFGEALGRYVACAWVRPLRGIVCTLATQHETAEIVHFEINAHGLKSGDVTWGHRFMAPEPIHVRRYDDYVDALHKAKVVLDADRRKAIILADAKDLAFAQGLTLVEDEGLLEEVAGLVEWPVVLMGEFEAAFLDLPPEVIRATIRANQKCFVLREAAPASSSVMAVPGPEPGIDPAIHGAPTGAKADGAATRNDVDGRHKAGHDAGASDGEGKLANKFILVSNLVAPDGGAAIAAGNARVVRARLADARHFWLTDRAPLPDAKDKTAKPLDQRLEKLERVVFHEKSGTQGERIARIEALARELAPTSRRRRWSLRRAPLISPRPTSRRKWSASSLSCRDSWAATTRSRKARSRASPTRSRTTTSRKGRTTAFPLRRSRLRSRSPTSSTRWSASGRSTRSRPAARTPMRCGARRSASSALCLRTGCGLPTQSVCSTHSFSGISIGVLGFRRASSSLRYIDVSSLTEAASRRPCTMSAGRRKVDSAVCDT